MTPLLFFFSGCLLTLLWLIQIVWALTLGRPDLIAVGTIGWWSAIFITVRLWRLL